MADSSVSTSGQHGREVRRIRVVRREQSAGRGVATGSILLFFLAGFWVFLTHQNDFSHAVTTGMLVPDSVNMAQTLENFWAQGDFLQDPSQFLGVSLLYGWTWLLHPSLCFLLNCVLMLLAIRSFRDIIGQTGMAPWAMLGLTCNVYLVLAMPGPNKELPLVLITLLYTQQILAMRSGWILKALTLAAVAYAFRDGYGVFLAAIIPLIAAMKRTVHRLPLWILAAAVVLMAGFQVFRDVLPLLERNYTGYEAVVLDGVAVGALALALGIDVLSPLGGVALFFLRLVYNLLSLSLFPILQTDTGHVYWIGVGYWLFGLMVFGSLACCMAQVLRRQQGFSVGVVAGLSVSVLLMVSISLFVQPRYLMPVLPLAIGALSMAPARLRSRCVGASVIVSLAIMALYGVVGRSPAAAEVEDFEVPPYVWAR
jgi:hypothetical protein